MPKIIPTAIEIPRDSAKLFIFTTVGMPANFVMSQGHADSVICLFVKPLEHPLKPGGRGLHSYADGQNQPSAWLCARIRLSLFSFPRHSEFCLGSEAPQGS